MPFPKPVRWILRSLALVVAALIVAVALLAFAAIPIDLTPYKHIAEPVVSDALGRAVTIDGSIVIHTSIKPAFTIEGLHIANPEGFSGDFAVMDKAHIQVSLLPLLVLKAHIQDLTVEGLVLDLQKKNNGTATWSLKKAGTKAAPPTQSDQSSPTLKERGFTLVSDSLVLNNLDIHNIIVNYQKDGMENPVVFTLESWTGNGLPGQPFAMEMKGSVDTHPFSATVKVSSLEEFIEKARTWLDINVNIAETSLTMSGMVDVTPGNKALSVNVGLKGDQLESLIPLIGIKLPQLSDYEAKSAFKLTENHVEMTDFLVRVRSSSLTGHMTLDTNGPLPVANIQFTSPTIDIHDFLPPDFGKADNATTAEPEDKPSTTQSTKEVHNFLSPEVLKSFEATLDIKVEDVRSGKDKLGSGHLRARVKESVFTLDPLTINIPGGSFFFALSAQRGKASVQCVTEDFDFGIINRMYQPNTDMGGTISLDMNLDSKSETLKTLLANANGYIDLIAHPVNMHAGIVDLWVVNLVSSILSKSDGGKGSTVNCAVARMTMNNGMLTPDIFVIDTTTMRICGRGSMDFKQELIDLDVRPSAKKAEYFSLETPLAVQGSFTDFNFGIARGGIFGTVVGFITSPITATARRLGGTSALPLDGSDVCSMTIGAKDRPTGPVKGCLPPKKSYQR